MGTSRQQVVAKLVRCRVKTSQTSTTESKRERRKTHGKRGSWSKTVRHSRAGTGSSHEEQTGILLELAIWARVATRAHSFKTYLCRARLVTLFTGLPRIG